MFQLLGIDKTPNVDWLYKAMDWLNKIGKRIVNSHLKMLSASKSPLTLLLFDVTNLWVEG